MVIKVIHERANCIGCGACAAISSDFWKMDEDGLSTLIGSKEEGDKFTLEISEDKKTENQDAADVCPVQIIIIEEE